MNASRWMSAVHTPICRRHMNNLQQGAGKRLVSGGTVVANNLAEFTRVPGLRCENWAEAA
jgi:predicted nucleic acid-binding protein